MRTRTVTVKPLLRHFFLSPEKKAWLASWAEKCGLTADVAEDPHAWVSSEFYYGLFGKIAEWEKNPEEALRRAAVSGMSPESLGTLHVLARAFGKPTSTYARYAVYANSLQDIGRYELHVLHSGAATISFTPSEKLPHQDLDCAYRRGFLETVPTLWRLPPARISHECCQAKGDPRCIYELTWLPLARRRIAWASAAAGLGLGAIIWAALAAGDVVPFSAPLTAAGLVPWAGLGYLAGLSWLLRRQLRDTSQLMSEQMNALERELGNVWGKCEEIEHKADEEGKIRKLFQKYVPSPVVERVLDKGTAASGGESLDVTVLFADLVGFTPYSEGAAPGEVMATVNRYLGRFSEVVGTYGGVVDKYIGDNVMAVFGAPVLDPYGPEKAVNCAQHLLKTVREVNDDTGLDFDLRIGINHGPAVAGHVGSAERVNYTVMGDTVNLAQRLQNEAEPGRILVSRDVRTRCDNSRNFRERETIVVRGRKDPTPVFELG